MDDLATDLHPQLSFVGQYQGDLLIAATSEALSKTEKKTEPMLLLGPGMLVEEGLFEGWLDSGGVVLAAQDFATDPATKMGSW